MYTFAITSLTIIRKNSSSSDLKNIVMNFSSFVLLYLLANNKRESFCNRGPFLKFVQSNRPLSIKWRLNKMGERVSSLGPVPGKGILWWLILLVEGRCWSSVQFSLIKLKKQMKGTLTIDFLFFCSKLYPVHLFNFYSWWYLFSYKQWKVGS